MMKRSQGEERKKERKGQMAYLYVYLRCLEGLKSSLVGKKGKKEGKGGQ